MKQAGHRLIIVLCVAFFLSGLFLVSGCEVSGQYEGENVKVQVGSTNTAAQADTQ